jgi:hypothetical protein
MLGVLAQQGRMGSVEVSDLARDFGKLGAATRAFEGKAPDLMRSMGAFAQIAVESGGAEGSADASTAAARLASDIVTNRKRFKNLGVDVKSKTDASKLRAPEEIMLDVLEKTGGDITKTGGLFGMESAKIFRGLSATFTEAEKNEKGSGRAKTLAEFNRFAGAKLDPAERARQAQSQLDEPSLKFKEAAKQFNNEVGETLLPVLTQLIPQFTAMIPNIAKTTAALAKFAAFVAENPLKGLGAIIAGKVALDLAGAGIGNAVRGTLESILSGAGGAGGGLGKGAKVGLAGAAAVGSVAMAVGQAQDLAKASGGWEGIWEGVKSTFSGDGFAKGVDDFQNKKALERFNDPFSAENMAARMRPAVPSDIGTPQLPPGLAVQNARGERVDFASLPPAQQQQLLASASALTEAAGAIKGAAAELGNSRPALNRGNTPASPVP